MINSNNELEWRINIMVDTAVDEDLVTEKFNTITSDINQLKNKVLGIDELSVEVNTITSDISELKNKVLEIDELSLAVSNLLNNITDVEGKTSELEEVLKQINEKIGLKAVILNNIPNQTFLYDFEDGISLFTVPRVNDSNKGSSSIITENENKFQSVKTSGSVGSNNNIYSQFVFPDGVLGTKGLNIEFDFQYVSNGRFRIAMADLDVINNKTNADLRWNYDGIVADIFSNSSYTIQTKDSSKKSSTLFGQWLHAKYDIDFEEKSVNYTISTNNQVLISGKNVTFRDETANAVTGIALYTWLSGDEVYFDNIFIKTIVDLDLEDNTICLVPFENAVQAYIYRAGELYIISS